MFVTDMNYTIRPAKITDMALLLGLIHELATFENEANAVEVSVEDLENDGFGNNKLFQCFVAQSDKDLIGAALVYPRYSTWKGPVLHLEDLIVTEKCRGLGVGRDLLSEVVKYGNRLGVKRISWEVLDWNEPAIEFYEKIGANVMRDWDVVQLNEEAIAYFLDNHLKLPE